MTESEFTRLADAIFTRIENALDGSELFRKPSKLVPLATRRSTLI